MALTMADVLASPALQHSRPQLLAGDPAARTVRWVHSSEIYEIARLLRGGELLLTTGLGLEGRSGEQRRAYVRALAAKEIAGLALELSDSFSAVPAEMVEEAQRLGLPFVVLREVYPFVEVTEQVNSAILDSSVSRLRHADEVGRALSLVLAERGGLDVLVATLAELVGRPAVLVDSTGAVLVAAAGRAEDVLAGPAATAPVTADGILLGGLAIGGLATGSGDSADDLLLAAIDRAPEILALAVLRDRQQSLLTGRDRRDLLARLLARGGGGRARRRAPTRRPPGCRPRRPVGGLAVGAVGPRPGVGAGAGRRPAAGVRVLAAEVEGRRTRWWPCPAATRRRPRRRCCRSWGADPVFARRVGPVRPASAAGRSLRAAAQALALGPPGGSAGGPLVADELVVERVLAAVGDRRLSPTWSRSRSVHWSGAARAAALVATLEVYLDSGCWKAATARVLHLRRQSVHQRLARIDDPAGARPRRPSAQTALRLALAASHLA